MPNPVSCQLNPSQAVPTFDCEPVVIDGSVDPSQSPATAETQQTAAPPPAVQQLIQGATTTRLTLDWSSPGLGEVLAERGERCLSEVNAVALLVAAGVKSPVAGFLAAFKTAVDLVECTQALVQESSAEDMQRARDAQSHDCLHRGGVVAGQVGNEMTCYVEVERP